MGNPSLYDDDILLWSEQQADVLRRLGRTRPELSNELDVENVAEEIESVGRSELAAVKSYIQAIFIHLIKLAVETSEQAQAHWESEIIGFHANMIDRYSPSMRQRIDIEALWRLARRQSAAAFRAVEQHQWRFMASIPINSPFTLDELLAAEINVSELAQRLRRVATSADGSNDA